MVLDVFKMIVISIKITCQQNEVLGFVQKIVCRVFYTKADRTVTVIGNRELAIIVAKPL